MPEEPLFEVWVDGIPVSRAGEVVRGTRHAAEALAAAYRYAGFRASVVPDQSKRPPDEEMLQDR